MITWYWFAGSINRGYLPLAEGIVQGIVDLADRETETCGGLAVYDQIGFEPVLLLIETNIGQDRHLSQDGLDFGGPVGDFLDVIALKIYWNWLQWRLSIFLARPDNQYPATETLLSCSRQRAITCSAEVRALRQRP